MANNWSKGIFVPKNPEKYIGKGNILYRSSWENNFMRWCDTCPGVLKWASEAIRVPYRNPITGKNTSYVPDFFVQYVDKNNKVHTEVIEIKPQKHYLMEKAGKNKYNQAQVIINNAKWAACNAFCKSQGMTFRVISETDLFHNGKTK